MISVCFRFDDPSPIGDKEVEHGALEIFARHDLVGRELAARVELAALHLANAGEGRRADAAHVGALERDRHPLELLGRQFRRRAVKVGSISSSTRRALNGSFLSIYSSAAHPSWVTA